MTRPLLAVAALALLPFDAFAAEGFDAALEAARLASARHFELHQPGQPSVEAAVPWPPAEVPPARKAEAEALRLAILGAADVQKGCEAPCSGEAELALYRAKVEAASAALGLDGEALAAAVENYLPGGAPRLGLRPGLQTEGGRLLEAKAVQALLSDPKLPAKVRDRLQGRAAALAAALGRTTLVDLAEGASASVWSGARAYSKAAAAGAGVLPRPPPGFKPKAPPPAPAASAVIPVAQVESRFRTALTDQVRKYPTGREVLAQVKVLPTLKFEKMEPDTFAYHNAKGNGTLAYNTIHIADAIKQLDPAAASAGDLTDAKVLRQYLSTRPGMLDRLVTRFDATFVHEMTHAAQHHRTGTGFINDVKDGWITLLNGRKYPIEYEWEAFGAESRYYHDKVLADPGILRSGPGGFNHERFDYEEYVRDLSAYRRDKAATYQGDCKTLDRMRFLGHLRPYYARVLAQEERAWPRLSYEGLVALARADNDSKFPPMMVVMKLQDARGRAQKHGFYDEKAQAELAGVFRGLAARMEEQLAKPGNKPPLGPGLKKALLQMSADLKVPLPRLLAAAAAS